MSAMELLELLAKISGPISLGIISLPKLTEMIIGRSISVSLEKKKAALQLELEQTKSKLTAELETHKAGMQRDLAREQRTYVESLARKNANAAAAHTFYTQLSNRIDECLTACAAAPQQAYQTCCDLLDEAFLGEAVQVTPIEAALKEIDRIAEAPAALSDPHYQHDLQDALRRLHRVVRDLIAQSRTHGK